MYALRVGTRGIRGMYFVMNGRTIYLESTHLSPMRHSQYLCKQRYVYSEGVIAEMESAPTM